MIVSFTRGLVPWSLDERRSVVTPVDCMDYFNRFNSWLQYACCDADRDITKRGAMMGEPTSWAVLPLVTFYALEKAGKWAALTTGDDALVGGLSPLERERYDSALRSLGGVISAPKSFYDRHKGLFCEAPYKNGKKEKILSS